jgi:hypothetical protein
VALHVVRRDDATDWPAGLRRYDHRRPNEGKKMSANGEVKSDREIPPAVSWVYDAGRVRGPLTGTLDPTGLYTPERIHLFVRAAMIPLGSLDAIQGVEGVSDQWKQNQLHHFYNVSSLNFLAAISLNLSRLGVWPKGSSEGTE